MANENKWLPLVITQANIAGGFTIVLTTDIPCHLFLYWTEKVPWVHRTSKIDRGLAVPWDAYWCYVVWTLIDQNEPGDTLIHTYTWTGWQNCQTKYFRFHGTIGGNTSPSDSPIFHKHYFYEAPPVPPIEYLRPTGPGLRTGISSQEPDVGEHWDKVADAIPDDNTYVFDVRRSANADNYLTQDTAYDAPIDKVVFHARAMGNPPWGYIHFSIYTYTYYNSDITYLTAVWQDIEWELINNPHTGEPWTQQELNDLQLGIALYAWEYLQTRCSHLYAAVHRTP